MKLVADEKDYEAWLAWRRYVDGKWSYWREYGSPRSWPRQYREGGLQYRWLARIVVRAFADFFRQRRRRPRPADSGRSTT